MWPSQRTQGPQLAYGTYDGGIVTAEKLGDLNFGPLVKTPRLRSLHPTLHEVKHALVLLSPPVEPETTNEIRSIRNWWTDENLRLLVAPSDLIFNSTVENNAIANSYESFRGRTLAVADLGPVADSNQKLWRFLASAFVSGHQKNFLNFVGLVPKTIDTPENDEIATFAASMRTKKEFDRPILQIAPSAFSGFVAVRLASSIIFLMVKLRKKAIVVDQIQSISGDFCDVQPSPFRSDEFITVDTSCCVTRLRVYRQRATWSLKALGEKLTIEDEFDSTQWKRLCWTKPQQLVLFTRSSATVLDHENNTQTRIVSAHTWAKIQDATWTDAGALFVLTSYELVWVDSNSMTRVLSWKHFLSPEDASLKLAVFVHTSRRVFVCAVYSETTPVVVFHTFGFHDQYPCLLRDPYMRSFPTDGIRNLVMQDANSKTLGEFSVAVLWTGTSHQVEISTFDTRGDFKLKNTEPSSPPKKAVVMLDLPSFPLTKNESESLWRTLAGNLLVEEADEGEKIQDFASKVGESLLSLHSSARFAMLADVAGSVPTFHDTEEFENMLSQMRDHTTEEGWTLDYCVDFLKSCRLGGNRLESTAKVLAETFPSGPATNAACVALRSTLTTISLELYERNLSTLRTSFNGLSEDLQALALEWVDLEEHERTAREIKDEIKLKTLNTTHLNGSSRVLPEPTLPLTQNPDDQSVPTPSQTQATQPPPISQLSQVSKVSNSPPRILQLAPPMVSLQQNKKKSGAKRLGISLQSSQRKKKKGGFA